MMGLRPDQIRVIPSDENYRIRVDLLEEMIEKDIKEGKKPFLIVGSCGTTNTGAIDPFEDLAKIRDKYNMWLHADGAYGGSILFSNIYCNLAKGVDKVDTFSWDTHKWALQGYSSSVVLAKDKSKWIDAFIEHPEYLADVQVSVGDFHIVVRQSQRALPHIGEHKRAALLCLGTLKSDVVQLEAIGRAFGTLPPRWDKHSDKCEDDKELFHSAARLEVDKKAPIRLHRPEQQVLRPGIKIAVEEQGQCHRAIEAEVHLLVEGQEVDLHPEAGKEVAEPIALRLRRDGWRGSVAPLQAAARG